MTKGLMSFFQYSRAETFKNFSRPLNYLFIGHSCVNFLSFYIVKFAYDYILCRSYPELSTQGSFYLKQ